MRKLIGFKTLEKPVMEAVIFLWLSNIRTTELHVSMQNPSKSHLKHFSTLNLFIYLCAYILLSCLHKQHNKHGQNNDCFRLFKNIGGYIYIQNGETHAKI